MIRIEFVSNNGIRFVISKDTQKKIKNLVHVAKEFLRAFIKLVKEELEQIFKFCE